MGKGKVIPRGKRAYCYNVFTLTILAKNDDEWFEIVKKIYNYLENHPAVVRVSLALPDELAKEFNRRMRHEEGL